MDSLLHNLYRFLFVVALGLAGLGVAEGVVQLAGQSIFRGLYSAGRLFEFSGIVVLFVLTLLVRDIRNDVRSKRS